MEIQPSRTAGSPSSFSLNHPNPNPDENENPNNRLESWWEAITKARSRIFALSSIHPSFAPLSSLANSDNPARSLLQSPDAYVAISSFLSDSFSGSGEDRICLWLYETFQSSDPDLLLVFFSFIPLVAGLYLSRVVSCVASDDPTPSLGGFEAVLLTLYNSETRNRGGKPILIEIPDLSQPSLYKAPRNRSPRPVAAAAAAVESQPETATGVYCLTLEPQESVMSTKRACIVAVALDCYFKNISQMPSWSKLDLCQFANGWAGMNCPCNSDLDRVAADEDDEDNKIRDAVEGLNRLRIGEEDRNEIGGVSRGSRIPLPWELLQPVLRILGHCLFAPLNKKDVMNAASVSVRRLYARASHDLFPQAILATRSLIKLDNKARLAAKASKANTPNQGTSKANTPNQGTSKANTPRKGKKPIIGEW